MKKIIYLLFFLFAIKPAFAQDGQPNEGKLREKMVDYIQAKLGLSRGEAEKFQPVFVNYFKDLRRTTKEFKGDRLILQQKIVEVRLRYRDQFKPIIGEKRSNEVFERENEFIQTVRGEINERRQERREGRADKGKNSKLLQD
ncbi:MAG: hypothetical protein JWR72_2208 [Flavisolibacter sp.]|jgi:hypothetical protein|nr:hypothetical protein [Flavisolibacter sp.]